MTIIQNVNYVFNNYISIIRENQNFYAIKKKIRKLNNKIIFDGIKTNGEVIENQLNQYISFIIQKYPSLDLKFENCTLNRLNITTNNTPNIIFNNCHINKLSINDSDKTSVHFNNCQFEFNDNKGVLVQTREVDLNSCVIDTTNTINNKMILGKSTSSSVRIRNQKFISNTTMPFQVYVNSNSLTLSEYKSLDNIELVLNEKKACDYINIINSDVNFSDCNITSSNMLLIEYSSISNLDTKVREIELVGDCEFNNVTILDCEDLVINSDARFVTKNFQLNLGNLECGENSEINDINGRFKWLRNIKKIIAYKDFCLKHNDKIIYKQEKKYVSSNDEEEIVEVVNKNMKHRR